MKERIQHWQSTLTGLAIIIGTLTLVYFEKATLSEAMTYGLQIGGVLAGLGFINYKKKQP